MGTFTELSKNDNIKGIDDLGLGIVFLCIWIFIYLFVKKLWLNILFFCILVIGVYGITSGIIKIMVSLFYKRDTDKKNSKEVLKNVIKILPALASFVLIIFNIVKVFLEIKKINAGIG